MSLHLSNMVDWTEEVGLFLVNMMCSWFSWYDKGKKKEEEISAVYINSWIFIRLAVMQIKYSYVFH